MPERYGAQLPLEKRKIVARRVQDGAVSRTSGRRDVDAVWKTRIGMPFAEAFQDYMASRGSEISASAGGNVTLESHDMVSVNSSDALERALTSTSGGPTADSLLKKAIAAMREIENRSSTPESVGQSFILEVFLPRLIRGRGVGSRLGNQLKARARQSKLEALN